MEAVTLMMDRNDAYFAWKAMTLAEETARKLGHEDNSPWLNSVKGMKSEFERIFRKMPDKA